MAKKLSKFIVLKTSNSLSTSVLEKKQRSGLPKTAVTFIIKVTSPKVIGKHRMRDTIVLQIHRGKEFCRAKYKSVDLLIATREVLHYVVRCKEKLSPGFCRKGKAVLKIVKAIQKDSPCND